MAILQRTIYFTLQRFCNPFSYINYVYPLFNSLYCVCFPCLNYDHFPGPVVSCVSPNFTFRMWLLDGLLLFILRIAPYNVRDTMVTQATYYYAMMTLCDHVVKCVLHNRYIYVNSCSL